MKTRATPDMQLSIETLDLRLPGIGRAEGRILAGKVAVAIGEQAAGILAAAPCGRTRLGKVQMRIRRRPGASLDDLARQIAGSLLRQTRRAMEPGGAP